MRGCRPSRSRRRLTKPGDLGLAHRGRRDHRSGGPALRRTSRLIPEASGGIMTADDDDAMLAALVRRLGSGRGGTARRVCAVHEDAGITPTHRPVAAPSVSPAVPGPDPGEPSPVSSWPTPGSWKGMWPPVPALAPSPSLPS